MTYNPKLTGERMNEVNEASPASETSDVERVVIWQNLEKGMNQTKLGSLIEAIVNVIIGLFISLIANHFIFPAFGFYLSIQSNIAISIIYTIISIARQYVLRRWFNKRLHIAAIKLAERVAI